jgi:hypothetical protein
MKLSIKTKIPLVHVRGLVAGIQQGILTLSERQALPMPLYKYLTSLPISANTPNEATH